MESTVFKVCSYWSLTNVDEMWERLLSDLRTRVQHLRPSLVFKCANLQGTLKRKNGTVIDFDVRPSVYQDSFSHERVIVDWLCCKSVTNVVHQTINIMYDCHNSDINGYDFYILTNAGVNIFNVDLTKHDQTFFEIVKEAIITCEKIETVYSHNFYKPIGLSVTMSVKEPYEVDNRVDIIILKDITKTEELLEFRKRNKRFSSIPILAWPSNYRIEDLNELIKRSAGIFIDRNFLNVDVHDFLLGIKAAKKSLKPIFHLESSILQDYLDDITNAQERRILAYTNNLMVYGIDGVVVMECIGKSADNFIQALIRATEFARLEIQPRKKYFEQSFQTYMPSLPPIATAFGASLAALNSEAKAIIVLTMSGASARLLAKSSPPCHIIAVTAHDSTARQLHLCAKVLPVYYEKNHAASWHEERIARVAVGTQFGFKIGLFDFSAKLVVLEPLEEGVGYCNSFHIIEVRYAINANGVISCLE